jgi:hypothetical protein
MKEKIDKVLNDSKEYSVWETAKILAVTGEQENACSCKGCVSMCQRTPCLGTPTDILKLIQAGHKEKIMPTLWAASIFFGQSPIPMLQIERNPVSGCVFLNEQNLCSLHDTGLKPTEGKFASHSPNMKAENLTLTIAKTWVDPKNFDLIDTIIETLEI